MGLKLARDVAEEGPWCGTGRKPSWWKILHPKEPPPQVEALSLMPGAGAGDPGPNPWRNHPGDPGPGDPWIRGYVTAALYAAIALSQASERIGGTEGAQIEAFAKTTFDDYCGTIPFSTILQILLHIPPPPDPWLREFLFAVDMVQFANTLPAAQKEAYAGGARKVIAMKIAQGGATQ